MNNNTNKKHQEELNELLQPIFEYMQKNLHPHCTLLITSTEGQLVEGICGLKANNIVDYNDNVNENLSCDTLDHDLVVTITSKYYWCSKCGKRLGKIESEEEE